MGVRDLFGLRRKESATARAVTRLASPGRAVWTPHKYEALAREGYELNAVVYACVNEVTRATKGIPWVLFRASGSMAPQAVRHRLELARKAGPVELRRCRNQLIARKDLTPVDTHELLNLLRRPNPEQGFGSFMESYTGFLLMAGNSYLEAVGPTSRVAPPRELWPLRPDRMRVIPGDGKRRVAGYEYTVPGQDPVKFDADPILHTKFFHPTNDWYGLSPIAAAARAVDRHNAAEEWNTALLQNSARPSGALVNKGQTVDEDEIDDVKDAFKEDKTGPRNAGAIVYLEGDLDWKQMGLTPQDMDWLNSQNSAVRLICAAIGVSPILIDMSENVTYANYREARKALYLETVLPLLDHMRDDWNQWLTPRFGDALLLDYDADGIEELQEDRDKVWARVLNPAAPLTENEKRVELGYDPLPGGDVIRVPATVRLVGEDYQADEPAAPVVPEDTPVKAKAFNLAKDGKAVYAATVDAVRTQWEAAFETVTKQVFRSEGPRVIDAIRASGDAAHAVSRMEDAVDVAPWKTAYAASYVAIMEDFGERVLAGLKEQGVVMETKAIEDWFSEAAREWMQFTTAKRVTAVTDMTKATLAGIIETGFAQGESMDDIAARIGSTYQDFGAVRSLTIARTEVIAASSAGSRFAALSTGLPLQKQWLSSHDSRVRDSHHEIDGETTDMHTRYTNGCMFPGDPAGRAEEVINCRCTEVYLT